MVVKRNISFKERKTVFTSKKSLITFEYKLICKGMYDNSGWLVGEVDDRGDFTGNLVESL